MVYKKLDSMVHDRYQSLMWGSEGKKKDEEFKGAFLSVDPQTGHAKFNEGVKNVLEAIEEREDISIASIIAGSRIYENIASYLFSAQQLHQDALWFHEGIESALKAIETATKERENITVDDIRKELREYFP